MFQKVQHIVLYPIRKHRVFFLFALFMTYAIGLAGNLNGAPSDHFLNFLLNIFDVYLVCGLVCLCERILKRWPLAAATTRWTLYIATSWVLFCELFVVFFYHSLFSVHVMLLLLETNSSESIEFIRAALSNSACYLTLGLTAAVAALAYGLVWGVKKLRHPKARVVLTNLVLLLVLWSGVRQIPAYYDISRCFFHSNTLYCAKQKDILHLNTPAMRVLFGLAFNKASVDELDLLATAVADQKVTACTPQCPLIVLIIGESYNKHHAHLYNPLTVPNTPYLDSLETTGNLIKYADAITPYNMTSHVFKYLFSMYDEQGDTAREDSWLNHSLFPALFRQAGYQVFFVTNQFVPSSNDDWDAMGSTFINNSRLSTLQFTWRNQHKYTYDDQLLADIPDTSILTRQPTLLIVHLIGQHVDYRERYPEAFRRFASEQMQAPHGGQAIRAEYANSILFNDHILHRIYQLINHHDALAIYLSDHGEEVYDWRDTYERTQERPIPAEAMKHQYEVPLLFFLTDSFRLQHPDLVTRIKEAQNQPAVNTNISHTLVWLGGITSPEYNPQLDILSPDYDNRRPRMLWQETYYKSK